MWQTKHGLKVKYTCKLINSFNSFKAKLFTKPIESWYGVKYLQLNKLPNKDTNSCWRASWRGHFPNNNKHDIKIFHNAVVSLKKKNRINILSIEVVYYIP